MIAELRKLVGEEPLREGLWLQLIRALDGVGRHAEALGAYARAREAARAPDAASYRLSRSFYLCITLSH